MTQAAQALPASRASESKLVTGVCFAHLVSHYYMLTLAPLFAFIRADFGVSYTELSLALTAFGLVSAALFLAVQAEPAILRPPHAKSGAETASASAGGWPLLLSAPILLNLVFFVVLSMVGGGLNQYLVVGLGALYATPPGLANTALTGLLAMSAIGVLLGGVLAGRTARHNLVACAGLLVTAAASTVIAFID